MAVDNSIVHGAPGIAGYESETWGNVKELRLSDTPASAVDNIEIAASGAALEMPIFSVVRLADGNPSAQDGTGGVAYGVTTAPVSLADGETITLDVLVAGNFDIDALTFDASFTTDAQKLAAFRGAPAPVNIILGKNPHNSDAIYP